LQLIFSSTRESVVATGAYSVAAMGCAPIAVRARRDGGTLGRVSTELAHPPHPVVLPAAPGWPIHPAMVTVAFELPSFRVVRSLGVVRGVSIRGNADGGADLATVADPAQTYSQRLATICEQARFQAHLLMLQAAAQVGGNGVIGVCYETAPIHQSMFEVLAYGTAVWAEYIEDAPVFVAHGKAIEPPSALARRDDGDGGR
jgi:uncharacterized protein YbjQ (UPF0145 family)